MWNAGSSSTGPAPNPNERFPKAIAPKARDECEDADRCQKDQCAGEKRIGEFPGKGNAEEQTEKRATGELDPEASVTGFILVRCHGAEFQSPVLIHWRRTGCNDRGRSQAGPGRHFGHCDPCRLKTCHTADYKSALRETSNRRARIGMGRRKVQAAQGVGDDKGDHESPNVARQEQEKVAASTQIAPRIRSNSLAPLQSYAVNVMRFI